MTIELLVPDSIAAKAQTFISLRPFLQCVLNRFAVGGLRYGLPARRQRYLRRLKAELAAYERTGNHEHLLNVATYAYLESEAPSHPRYHFDATVASVTRFSDGSQTCAVASSVAPAASRS